ncbi:hypothetical protein PMIN06_009149 [Paraphaeosphaeria minitans]
MQRRERQPRDPMYTRTPAHARWPEKAQYAPNYPIHSLKVVTTPAPAPAPVLRIPIAPVAPAPYASAVFATGIPQYFARTSPPRRSIQPQVRRKISFPKKQVHFNLPLRSPPHRYPPRRASQAHLHLHLPDHTHTHTHGRPPTPADPPRRRTSTHNLAPQPAPPPPPPSPSHPTVWIVTYAHSLAATPSAAHETLTSHLPPGTPHLYTIHAYNMTPPPPHICSAYSGVSPIVQDYVMRDPRARQAVADAVHSILAHGRREMRMEQQGRRAAETDVALSVCCVHGTHRSVGIAERIAQRLMGMKLGARVVVRHVHRVKGIKDPY